MRAGKQKFHFPPVTRYEAGHYNQWIKKKRYESEEKKRQLADDRPITRGQHFAYLMCMLSLYGDLLNYRWMRRYLRMSEISMLPYTTQLVI